jgi:hypothetical protein
MSERSFVEVISSDMNVHKCANSSQPGFSFMNVQEICGPKMFMV